MLQADTDVSNIKQAYLCIVYRMRDRFMYMYMYMYKPDFSHTCKNKDADKLCGMISAFVFATRIVQSLYFLNQKFQASTNHQTSAHHAFRYVKCMVFMFNVFKHIFLIIFRFINVYDRTNTEAEVELRSC